MCGVDRIQLSQDEVQAWAFVNTVIDFLDPLKAEIS
jgi:hypothetical protein